MVKVNVDLLIRDVNKRGLASFTLDESKLDPRSPKKRKGFTTECERIENAVRTRGYYVVENDRSPGIRKRRFMVYRRTDGQVAK